jgi:hypothetical protein
MGKQTATVCPVCKEYWMPWAGSRLPCHGKCLFTEEAQDELLDDPRTEQQIARDLGVTNSVVRAARGAARKRKG